MIPNRNEFYALADQSLAGLQYYHESLAVTHCTVAHLAFFIGDAKQKRQTYEDTRAGKRLAYEALGAAREQVLVFTTKARDYLTAFLGNEWTESWGQTGFTNNTLKVPQSDAGRKRVLEGVVAYFTAHPTQQSVPLAIGATQAQTLLDALNITMQTVRDCRLEQRTKREARDVAEATLDKKLRCLWNELESVLEPTDPRWLKFVNRIPGDPRGPETVEEVAASAEPGGIIRLDWPDTARAARYKVLKQVVGVDEAPVLAATVADSDAELAGFTTGATVQLTVVATNAVGDAPASEVVQLQAA